MKISELRPCDNCGKLLGPVFYVVRYSLAFVSPRAGREVVGLTQYFDGHLGLAEAMAPDPDVVKIAGDEDPKLLTEALVCQECSLGGALRLAVLMERAAQRANGIVEVRVPGE